MSRLISRAVSLEATPLIGRAVLLVTDVPESQWACPCLDFSCRHSNTERAKQQQGRRPIGRKDRLGSSSREEKNSRTRSRLPLSSKLHRWNIGRPVGVIHSGGIKNPATRASSL